MRISDWSSDVCSSDLDKYQVKKEDGTLDPDASWAKFVDGHEALQKKLGAGDVAPEKPEDYKLEAPKDAEGKPIEGVDFESFTKDPLFQSFQKAAHEIGRASGRERVCQYVSNSVVAVSLTKKKRELERRE